ncbi:MAG: 3-methyl-2-oxobutanoate hydroxymethyltransferase [Planctomycetota bacterium]
MSLDSPSTSSRKKITVPAFLSRKRSGTPITVLTAYDFATASILDRAEIDALLVGDSLAMVMLGHENTLSVTMDEMLHHCKAVARGAKYALLIGDMPFLSFQVDAREALRNAGRFLAEAGMDAVKLEGGREVAGTVRAIVRAGIPVMGHLGLTPQSIHMLGGFKTQATTADTARRLLEDAHILEEAGCFAIVLEKVPDRLARLVSEKLRIPTIGIGAGVHCDGQVLVTHDLLGLFDRFSPRFVKRYANLAQEMERAFRQYAEEVRTRSFPDAEHSFPMRDDECEKLMAELERIPLTF